jgi:hypothetical protein
MMAPITVDARFNHGDIKYALMAALALAKELNCVVVHRGGSTFEVREKTHKGNGNGSR